MGLSEIYYIVVGALGSVAVAAGCLVVSSEPNDFRLARGCFTAGTFALGSIAVVWNLTAHQNTYVRFAVVGITGGVVTIILAEGLRYVAKREHWVKETRSMPEVALVAPKPQLIDPASLPASSLPKKSYGNLTSTARSSNTPSATNGASASPPNL